MKKVLFLCFILSIPSYGVTQAEVDLIDKEISELTALRAAKNNDLEKCAKSVNGFKIAGISTLSLTAIGIGGNIWLSSENKKTADEIKSKEEKRRKELIEEFDDMAKELEFPTADLDASVEDLEDGVEQYKKEVADKEYYEAKDEELALELATVDAQIKESIFYLSDKTSIKKEALIQRYEEIKDSGDLVDLRFLNQQFKDEVLFMKTAYTFEKDDRLFISNVIRGFIEKKAEDYAGESLDAEIWNAKNIQKDPRFLKAPQDLQYEFSENLSRFEDRQRAEQI